MKAQLHADENAFIVVLTAETDAEFDVVTKVLSAQFQFALNSPRVKATDGSFPPMQLSFSAPPPSPRVVVPVPGLPPRINGKPQ